MAFETLDNMSLSMTTPGSGRKRQGEDCSDNHIVTVM